MAPARPNNAKATQATQHCNCQRLCRGGRDLAPGTYRSHKKYRDADLHQAQPDNNVPEHTARTQKPDNQHIAHLYSSTGVNPLDTHITSLPMDLDPLPSPRSPTPSASLTHNNNDFYPDNTEEAHEDVESESNHDPITLTQKPLPGPSLEKRAIPPATLQAINDAELLKTLRNPTSLYGPIDKITQLSIDVFVAVIGGPQRQLYDGVRNALASHNPPIQIHSYRTVQTIVEKITALHNSNMN